MSDTRSTWEDRSAAYGDQLTGVLFRGLSASANGAIDQWHSWLIATRLAPALAPGAQVLDVGCGEGVLLDLLTHEKQVDGRGLEISSSGVAACMARGLSVVQGDADQDLGVEARADLGKVFCAARSINTVPITIISGRCTASRMVSGTRPSAPTVRSTSGSPMKMLLAKAEDTPASTPTRWSR